MEDEVVRKRVLVSGRVQGVWFRGSTERVALELGVAGWVRNLQDGRVEAVFEGPVHAVDAAVDWTRRGPTHATVDGIELASETPQDLSGFSVR